MAFDLTKPIDISAFNDTVKNYQKDIKKLPMLAAQDSLKYFTAKTGIRTSYVITTAVDKTISKKYTGTFTGDKQIGTMENRTLTTYPIVAEMSDEPEKYRNSYIDLLFNEGVAAAVDPAKQHRFLLWLAQYGVMIASQDLYNVIWTAKFDATKTGIEDSFDGWEEIIRKAIVDGTISAANKNYYDAKGLFTSANIGDKLIEMWRMAHPKMRMLGGDMHTSVDMGDMYDDWYREEHDKPPMVDTAGQVYLEGSNGKCRIIRHANLSNQRVSLTTKDNMLWGTDKPADMSNMRAFESGNPYKFTATMKYIYGQQFESLNWRRFITNKRYDETSGSGS